MNALDIEGVRHDWTRAEVRALFDQPFMDLVFEAQAVHRRYHAANAVQLSQLLSIKTGGCAEDCAYCPQAQKFAAETGLKASKLMDLDWRRRAPPRPPGLRASAWARRGRGRRTAISTTSWRWWKASARWGWKAA